MHIPARMHIHTYTCTLKYAPARKCTPRHAHTRIHIHTDTYALSEQACTHSAHSNRAEQPLGKDRALAQGVRMVFVGRRGPADGRAGQEHSFPLRDSRTWRARPGRRPDCSGSPRRRLWGVWEGQQREQEPSVRRCGQANGC